MKRLLPYLQALLLGFLLVANATAQDEPPKQKESQDRDVSELNPDELRTFDEFRRHNTLRMRDYTRRYRAAAREDKAEVSKTRPTVEVYHPLLSKLVAEGTEEEAEKILSWWWHGDRGRRDAEMMSELLIEHHSESAILEKFVPRIEWAVEPEKAEALLRRVLEASEVESVRATTSFSLLQILSKKVKTVEGESAESLEAEIASLSEAIKTKYAKFTDLVDVPFGERLEGIEFSKQLVTGNPVPDIIGSDLDGVDFKLSDYKGNVVLISFWGQW